MGPGNNPYTALKQFLEEHRGSDDFDLDQQLTNHLLISNQKKGYLVRK